MDETEINVVHRHDRGGGLGGFERLRREMFFRLIDDRGDDFAVARGERRRDEGAPPLLLAEQRVHHEGGEIELLVPGIFGELFFQGFDRHRNSPRGNAARRRRRDRITFRPPSARGSCVEVYTQCPRAAPRVWRESSAHPNRGTEGSNPSPSSTLAFDITGFFLFCGGSQLAPP